MKRVSLRGFTLIELMITVVVIGILTAVALPSYRDHIAASRRADGKAAVMALAQSMERWYTERSTYAGATVAVIYRTTSPQGFYTMRITAQDAGSFSIRAVPRGAQVGDPCGSFVYNQAGTRSLASASLTVAQCW